MGETGGRSKKSRKKKKRRRKDTDAGTRPATTTPPKKRVVPGVVREPRTAAVLLSATKDAEVSLAEALRWTRSLAPKVLGKVPVQLKRA